MHRSQISRIVALSVLLAMPVFSAALADAPNGTFDGQWIVDVPSSPTISGTLELACPALRLPVRIVGGQVTGVLTRVPTRAGAFELERGSGADAAPVVGEIQPDGTVTAQWENYHANGRLSGDAGVITVQTACGPLSANAVRVSR